MYPDAGVCEMIGLLIHEHYIAVSRLVNVDMIARQNVNYKMIYRSTSVNPHLGPIRFVYFYRCIYL